MVWKVVAPSLGWLVGFSVILILTSDSPSKLVYAELSGWWAALYVSRACRANLLSVLFGFLLALFYFIFSVYLPLPVLNRDTPDSLNASYLIQTLLNAFIFVSPILIDMLLRKIQSVIFDA